MKSPFEQRVDIIRQEMSETQKPLTNREICARAKISHSALQKWLSRSRESGFNPQSQELLKLAKVAGRPMEWFLGETPAQAEVDTLALARDAADMLTRLDKVPPAVAWGLMRSVSSSSRDRAGYYSAARELMGPVEISPQVAAEILTDATAGLGRSE